MYDPSKIEKKWQDYWLENKTFKTDVDSSKEKYYILDMFPYPSGAGLHVGHPEGYTATDIVARYKRLNGFNVLYAMGWDAFGLPAENYAIKTGQHPSLLTENNIANFKRQIRSIGFSYDWDREINTTYADYYKWTQWIFIKLYEKGLAYESELPINWCPSCKTGLSNEEVVNGNCDRCGEKTSKKMLRQWVLKITEYADRLLEDLDDLDWPEPIKIQQRNWIGKSYGANLKFKIENSEETIEVYTTRPDTLFGATYMVLSPEHPLVDKLTSDEYKSEVEDYKEFALSKSDLERTDLNKNKTGKFIGAYAVNPVNSEKLPIWIADYVLMGYGTGAIMAVPAHDTRDYEFAKKFGLEIKEVIKGGDIEKEAYVLDGKLINSDFLNGLNVDDAKFKMIRWLEENGIGEASTNYKLKDWIFSRQRYWGEPIPVIHCEKCGNVILSESELPLLLPDVEKYAPSGTGESPLADIDEWVNTKCPKCNSDAKRETNTMPQWAGSSWYYLRYISPHNLNRFVDKEAENYWMNVDLYVGGAEHAVLHLLYARFWHKVLFDLGFVKDKEPFQKLVNQGMILGEDNEKMSKSRGNVINPDDVIKAYGADTLRLYEMFMGPFEAVKPWSTKNIEGCFRFLQKVYRLVEEWNVEDIEMTSDLLKTLHKTIKKVTEDIENFSFNTAISQMMIMVNELMKLKTIPKEAISKLIVLLYPFAPHIAEELWVMLGNTNTLSYETWPKYDEKLIIDNDCEIVFSVNGKKRSTKVLAVGTAKEDVIKEAMSDKNIIKYIKSKEIIKTIYIPNKLINIVCK